MTSHPTDNDDPRSVSTAVVGGVGVVLFIVIVLGLEALYGTAREETMTRKVVDSQPQELASYRREQNAVLEEYRWVDREAGVVAIPIERAMELVVRDRGASGQ